MEHFGLVPISYKDLDEVVHSFMGLSHGDAREAVATFDSFVKWLYSNESTMYGALFMRRANPIPFHEGRLRELREHMTSRNDFEKLLDEEDEAQDYASAARGF